LTTNNDGSTQVEKYSPGKRSILVVSPLTDLGELICESLKEVSFCEHFSNYAKTMTYMRQHENCHQAILDMEMGEMRLLDLGRALRRINPTIEIIIISKETPSTDLDAIQPWKFLRKPLLLHDLLITLGIDPALENISSNIIDIESEEQKNKSPLQWIDDPALATRQLAHLIEKSSIQEALLIQNNTLWSFTGKLSEASVQEVDKLISKSWDRDNETDLMRFIKLESSHTEHALYATVVAMGIILALVFDSEIPFSTVRSQTNKLATTLLLPVSETEQVKGLPCAVENGNDQTEEDPVSWKQLEKPALYPQEETLVMGSSSYTFNEFINTHLGGQNGKEEHDSIEEVTSPASPKKPAPYEQPFYSDQMLPSMEGSANPDSQGEIRDQLEILFEPVSDGLYNLTYSCLLIPRFISHHLTKDRENLVINCMKEIYTSYGWRLESLEARPDHLRWVGSLPPTIALSEHIEIIRKETSKRLFDDYPPYKEENLSNDYWAPGYLILGGKDAISDQLIEAYAKQSRQRYGFWKN
jgi:REP element-mobilizing transposase RayT/CheY-like chemotaxis protein